MTKSQVRSPGCSVPLRETSSPVETTKTTLYKRWRPTPLRLPKGFRQAAMEVLLKGLFSTCIRLH